MSRGFQAALFVLVGLTIILTAVAMLSGAGSGAILFAALSWAYFIPSLVAASRRIKTAAGVAIVNLFLGWTLIGWVIALAWAASGATALPAAPRAA